LIAQIEFFTTAQIYLELHIVRQTTRLKNSVHVMQITSQRLLK